MTEVIVAIIAAIASGLATYYIPLIHNTLTNGQTNSLNGEWLSLSYANESEGWVADRIEITTSVLSVTMKNKDKPYGYEYVARGYLLNNRYFNGKWCSTRQGSSNTGPFSFFISPQGQYLFGFYGGAEKDGSFRWAAWCLGRDQDSLDEAKRHILETAEILAFPNTSKGEDA